MVNRLLFVVGGLFILVIIFWIIASLLGGDNNKPNIIAVAQYQTELVRVASQASQTGSLQSSPATKNFAQSVSLSVASEQHALFVFIGAHGGKINPKILALKHDPQTDLTLKNAVAASNFDSTFKGVMRTDLTNYQNALKTAYAGAKINEEKQLLNDDFNDTVLLLKQLGDPDQ